MGDTIALYDNGRMIGSIVVTNSPMSWILPSLSDGQHSLSLVDTNAAGFSSAPVSLNFYVDVAHSPLNVPATPVFLGLTDHAMGNIGNGGTSHDATPVLRFSGAVGDTVELYDGDRLIGTIVVTNPTMSWTLPALTDGQHNLSLIETNAAGRSSTATSFSFTVDAGHPVAPAAPVFLGLFDHDMGNVGNGGTVHDSKPLLTFAAMVGDTISLYEGGQLLGTIVATSSPMSWTLPFMSNGNHAMSLVETNAAGVASQPMFFNFSVYGPTPAPVTPVAPVFVSLTDHAMGNVGNGGTLHDANPVLTFNAAAGHTYMLIDNGQEVGTITTTAATTSWTLPGMVDGSHYLGLIEIDAAKGTFIGQSMTLSVTVDTHSSQVVEQHIAVGQNDVFVGTAANETVDLGANAAQYFAQSTAHIQGGAGVDTLHLMGAQQVLDLSGISGKTAAAKLSGIEVFDLGGHANTLKVSAQDVLNLGEQDLFMHDGKQQLMIKGSNGDTFELSTMHVAGLPDGAWHFSTGTTVGGVMYNVFEHTGTHTELLIQQQVQITMH